MQSKISSFFKPSSSSSQAAPLIWEDNNSDDELALWEITQHQFVNTYKRTTSKFDFSEEKGFHFYVQEVIKMMEIELGEGWIFHKHCKVYLFIASPRVAGCLVAEPIKEAFRVIPSSEEKRSDIIISKTQSKSNSTTLRFGDVRLQREVIRKVQSANSLEGFNGNHNGAIVCSEEAEPALCGIRAIWVTPLNRRKHIASQLIDAVRSFCSGINLEISKIAFSPPTSAGKGLASSYTGTNSFMVYKPQI